MNQSGVAPSYNRNRNYLQGGQGQSNQTSSRPTQGQGSQGRPQGQGNQGNGSYSRQGQNHGNQGGQQRTAAGQGNQGQGSNQGAQVLPHPNSNQGSQSKPPQQNTVAQSQTSTSPHDNNEEQGKYQICKLATDKVIFDVRAYLENTKNYDDFVPKFCIVLRNYEKEPNEQVYCLIEADKLYELAQSILSDSFKYEFPADKGFTTYTGSRTNDGHVQSRIFTLKYDESKNMSYVFSVTNGPGQQDQRTGKVTPLVQVQGGRPVPQNPLPRVSVTFYSTPFDAKRFARKVIHSYETWQTAQSIKNAIAEGIAVALAPMHQEMMTSVKTLGAIVRQIQTQLNTAQ